MNQTERVQLEPLSLQTSCTAAESDSDQEPELEQQEQKLLGSKHAASIDDLLVEAGGCGSFQRSKIGVLSVTYGAASLIMMEPVFLNPLAEEVIGLTSMEAHTVTSFFFAAFFGGLFVWGWTGDTYGRRPTLLMSLLLLAVAAAIAPLMNSYGPFMLMRGLLLLQISKGALSVGWVAGIVGLVAIAWLLRDTHSLTPFSLCALPALFCLVLCYAFVPESPRWYLSTGNHEAASDLLTDIAITNLHSHSPDLSPLAQPKHEPGGGGFKMLWSEALIKPTVVIGFTQGIACLAVYGIAFSPESAQASADPYVSALLGALVELPAYILMCPAADYLGRKPAYSGFFGIAAVAMASYTMLAQGAMRTASLLTARFAAAGAATVVYVVSAEQFPTSCRNSGVGFGSSCGRIGAIVAPMMLEACEAPFVVFGALSLIAGFSVWLLKETNGAKLED